MWFLKHQLNVHLLFTHINIKYIHVSGKLMSIMIKYYYVWKKILKGLACAPQNIADGQDIMVETVHEASAWSTYFSSFWPRPEVVSIWPVTSGTGWREREVCEAGWAWGSESVHCSQGPPSHTATSPGTCVCWVAHINLNSSLHQGYMKWLLFGEAENFVGMQGGVKWECVPFHWVYLCPTFCILFSLFHSWLWAPLTHWRKGNGVLILMTVRIWWMVIININVHG